MKFSQLKKYLESKPENAFFLIEGNDGYFREKAVAMITDCYVSAFSEMNVVKIVTPTTRLIDENCSILPFASEKRAVVIKEWYPSATELQALSNLNFDSYKSSVLIISNGEKNISLKKIDSYTLIDCNREEIAVLARWITAMLKSQNKSIDEHTASMLALYCGQDMLKIDNEIKKLSNITSQIIFEKDIEENVAKDSDYQAYMFSNAVAVGDKKSYEILKDYISKGEASAFLQLLMSLYSNYKRMFYIKDSKLTKEQLSTALGIKPYAVSMTLKTAKLYSKEQLKKAMDMLADADYEIKSGNLSGETALYYAMAQLGNF